MAETVIDNYMLFYIFYTGQLFYNCLWGWTYLRFQRQKPKYRAIYYASDAYMNERQNMELSFETWNRRVRITLERLYRSQFVYSVSLTVQGFLILIVLAKQLSLFFWCIQLFIIAQSLIFAIKMSQLMRIKNKD